MQTDNTKIGRYVHRNSLDRQTTNIYNRLTDGADDADLRCLAGPDAHWYSLRPATINGTPSYNTDTPDGQVTSKYTRFFSMRENTSACITAEMSR